MSATLAGVSLSDIGRLAVGACFDEGAEAVINSISYHHDGEYLVTSSDDDAIRLYSVENATYACGCVAWWSVIPPFCGPTV